MMITGDSDSNLGVQAVSKKSSDILDCEKINALPHPISLELLDGDVQEVETLCVGTRLCRVLSCGMIDLQYFSFARNIIDVNGEKHDADYFYND